MERYGLCDALGILLMLGAIVPSVFAALNLRDGVDTRRVGLIPLPSDFTPRGCRFWLLSLAMFLVGALLIGIC